MPLAQHHEQFYFTLVTFLVEDCLFRVPRNTLESHSDVFHDLFLLPIQPDQAEGHSDKNPIFLEGIKKDEFRCLMNLLYPMPFTHLSSDGLPATLDEWTSVLKLSKMWGFTRIYNFAVQQMEPILAMRPLDKVALAHEYGVTRWFVSGLLQLARRIEPVGEEDVRRLGLNIALKLAEVRESMQTTQRARLGTNFDYVINRDIPIEITATGPRGSTTCDFTNRIQDVFSDLKLSE